MGLRATPAGEVVMPIYEFYCSRCHRMFNFLSRSVNTTRRPSCPDCGRRRLDRRPSRFAVSRGRSDREDDELDVPFDEAALERAIGSLAGEAEAIDDDDPRQAARLMRRVMEASGVRLGGALEEAIRRLEAGEDPDRIEDELGDAIEDDDAIEPAGGSSKIRRIARRWLPPTTDPTLHEM